MKKNQIKLRVRKVYSEPFKKARVKEYESGKMTVLEIARLYGICYQTVYKWIYQYSSYNKKNFKVVEYKDGHRLRVKDLQARIKELEHMVGKKQIRIDYLERILDLAHNEYGIDLKKNFNTPQSDGSESTDNTSHTA
jgi:transposase-like protein